MTLNHPAVERHGDAVRGDESEAAALRRAGLLRGVLPPVHDEVGAVRRLRPDAAQRFDVAVAQSLSHLQLPNERRIPHDEIGRRPLSRAWVQVAPLNHQGRLVRHLLARHRVHLEGLAVPALHQLAGRVAHRLLAVAGQHGVAVLDVAVVVDHRLGHAGIAKGADVPLQVAYPQHQFGQARRALVDLNAQQLLRRHRLTFEAQARLRFAQGLQLVVHLAFQSLHVFQRHVQKVAAAAGRVQHARRAQAVVEAPDLGAGLGQLVAALLAFQRVGFLGQHQRGGLSVGPVGAQWFHHGGQHQAFDVGARRVVRAQSVAFGGVQRALQQGAEDGGFHFAPVAVGCVQQAVDMAAGQRQHEVVGRAALEQLAVEAQQRVGQRGTEAAAVHVGPQGAQHVAQRGGLVGPALQQADESALAVGSLGQQFHVFGKHAEQAARQEGGHSLRGVAGVFQVARQRGQLGRHFARDLGTGARRVQRHRVLPQQAQPLARAGVAQVGQLQAVAAGVGEGRVGGTAARELGVQLQHMAHVHHQQEGRSAFAGRQCAGIAFGLIAGAHQGVVEALGRGARLDLLGFQHKGATAVAVDVAGTLRTITMGEGHTALEHVGVVARVVAGRVGLGQVQRGAKLGHEKLTVGPLGTRCQ